MTLAAPRTRSRAYTTAPFAAFSFSVRLMWNRWSFTIIRRRRRRFIARKAGLGWAVPAAVSPAALEAVAADDLLQRCLSVLPSYPLVGHLHDGLEKLRPELQQYFIERKHRGHRGGAGK